MNLGQCIPANTLSCFCESRSLETSWPTHENMALGSIINGAIFMPLRDTIIVGSCLGCSVVTYCICSPSELSGHLQLQLSVSPIQGPACSCHWFGPGGPLCWLLCSCCLGRFSHGQTWQFLLMCPFSPHPQHSNDCVLGALPSL